MAAPVSQADTVLPFAHPSGGSRAANSKRL